MEKKGGVFKTPGQLEGFQAAVEFCDFQDMRFNEYPFTCSNGREGENNIQLTLDCAFGTESLLLKFPFYKVAHGKRYCSDHSPC